MKKLAMSLLMLLTSATLYALPLGNPWDASLLCDGVCLEGYCGDPCDPYLSLCDAWGVRIGFYGDYVYDRHMEVDDKHNNSSIHKTEIWTNAGYLAFNMWNRFDIFATIGASHFKISAPELVWGPSMPDLADNYVTIESVTDLSWSVGARGTIWECGCFALGAEVQYFYARPDINFVREEDNPPVYLHNAHVKFQEWQVGIGAAYWIDLTCGWGAVPYLGVKWSRGVINMDNFLTIGDPGDPGQLLTLHNLESERAFSYAVGVTLVGCRKVSLGVEGRFIGEKALHVNGQIRF